MEPRRLRADLGLAGVALAWGGSFLVIKDTLELLPPHRLLVLRFGLAALAVAALDPRTLRPLDAATLRAGLGCGALLWGAFALQTLGLVHTTPAKSAFLTATYVPMVPLLGRLLLGTAWSGRVAFAAALALGGLAFLVHPTDLARVNRGDLLTLGGALLFAAHILALDRVSRRVAARPLVFLQLAVTALLALPPALVLEAGPIAPPAAALGGILYLGVVCSALAYAVQTWAQRHTLPVRVAPIFSLEAVFAALLAVALRGERLTAGEWLGGGLVVAAVVLGQWPSRWETAARSTG